MITVEDEIVPFNISNLVEQQFPDWYIEHGQGFVAFVQAYYQWMEQQGPLFYSRRYYNIKDIDTTLDEFIIFFKEKYLKNIQLDTKTDIRRLIKHSLDIYRSKGTERSVKLLFQLVFDENVKFYYPSVDLFKVSDGYWYKPQYLELILSEYNTLLVNKQVMGAHSKALAFVDSVVRRLTKGRLEDVAYISAVEGIFQAGEKIVPTDGSVPMEDCSVFVGSLSIVEVDVIGVGQDFAVGDVVTLSSDLGEGGKGLITGIIDQFGIVTLDFLNGGYGYRTNVDDNAIYVSDTTFTISNVQIANTGTLEYFTLFDPFTQTQVFLNYVTANGAFQPGDTIYTYTGGGSVKGQGTVITVNQSNTTDGTLLVGLVSGNLNDVFYTTANAVTAALNISNGYSTTTATGNFIANDNFLTLDLSNANGVFSLGEIVYQSTTQALVTSVDTNHITISEIDGIVHPELAINGLSSGATANISISIGVGLANVSGSFYAFANNTLAVGSITGYISRVDRGDGFSVALANNFSNTEDIQINTDTLAPFASVPLNAGSYGFSNSSVNASSPISSALSYSNVTIGKPINLVLNSPGENYTKAPFVVVDYPPVRKYGLHNLELTYTGDKIVPGEIITQHDSGARGMVLPTDDDNPNGLYVQNMRFYSNNQFVVTTSPTTQIVSSGGATANIVAISSDQEPEVMGLNLEALTNFAIGNGCILTLSVTDSGFGFRDGEDVFINGNTTVTGIGRVFAQGIGSGYYREKGGFLSDQKKLFDGYFWQNYSYQIISRLTMNKYQQMLHQLTHPAGTIMFGQLVYDTYAIKTSVLETASLTLSNFVNKLISSTHGQTVRLSRSFALSHLIQVTQAQTIRMKRAMTKMVASSQTPTIAIIKAIKTRLTGVHQSQSVIGGKQLKKVLTTTESIGTITLNKLRTAVRSITVTQTQSLNIVRKITKFVKSTTGQFVRLITSKTKGHP